MKIKVIAVNNRIKEFLTDYASKNTLKYSQAVKKLAESVDRDPRYIYAVINGASRASGELQFAIASFFGTTVDAIFLPVLSGNSVHNDSLQPTGSTG